jgi:hypothetical protein
LPQRSGQIPMTSADAGRGARISTAAVGGVLIAIAGYLNQAVSVEPAVSTALFALGVVVALAPLRDLPADPRGPRALRRPHAFVASAIGEGARIARLGEYGAVILGSAIAFLVLFVGTLGLRSLSTASLVPQRGEVLGPGGRGPRANPFGSR